jgi:hypothetical protein
MAKAPETGNTRPYGARARPNRREKTSITLSSDAKYRLTWLKAELRRNGHSATESGILEALILRAKPTDSHFRGGIARVGLSKIRGE